MEWEPIRTAPKDGTPIVVIAKNGGGFWTLPIVTWWENKLNGYWWADEGKVLYHAPLYWLPIPPPPK